MEESMHINEAIPQITDINVNRSNNSSRILVNLPKASHKDPTQPTKEGLWPACWAPWRILTLPLFVTELQDPLNILLGHKVVIFQGLKEKRRCVSRWNRFAGDESNGSIHLSNIQGKAEWNVLSQNCTISVSNKFKFSRLPGPPSRRSKLQNKQWSRERLEQTSKSPRIVK